MLPAPYRPSIPADPNSAHVENQFDSSHVPPPTRRLRADRAPAGRREAVVFRPPVVLGRPPVALDPPLLLEPLQRGIERPLIDVEGPARELLDACADPPPVHRLEGERFQNQQIEGPTQDVGLIGGHGFCRISTEDTIAPVGMQQESPPERRRTLCVDRVGRSSARRRVWLRPDAGRSRLTEPNPTS